MRRWLADTLTALARRLRPKDAPAALLGNRWAGTTFTDAYQRHRTPTANDLLAELKATAFTCATINAAACADNPPRLYVATDPHHAKARCPTRPLHPDAEHRLRRLKRLPPRVTKAARIEDVTDHPLLTLLEQVNPVHNQFDLWELTTLYQEVHGTCYWLLDFDPLGVPEAVWVLPAQNVTPKRRPDSPRLVDSYEYRVGSRRAEFPPERIIHFRYPDPKDPASPPATGLVRPLAANVPRCPTPGPGELAGLCVRRR